MAFQLPYWVLPILNLVSHGTHYSQGQQKQSSPWWEREFVSNKGLKLTLPTSNSCKSMKI